MDRQTDDKNVVFLSYRKFAQKRIIRVKYFNASNIYFDREKCMNEYVFE